MSTEFVKHDTVTGMVRIMPLFLDDIPDGLITEEKLAFDPSGEAVIVRAITTYDYSGHSETPSGSGAGIAARTDTVTTAPGDILLRIGETDAKLNGYWIAQPTGTNWARASIVIRAGQLVQVMYGGATGGGHLFYCRNTVDPVIGTDSIIFQRVKALPADESVTAASIAGGSLEVRHFAYIGPAPTIAAGPAAGTGPTISIDGTDGCGVFTVTTGTAPVLNDELCTITFAGAFGTAPDSVQLFQANDNAAGRITLLYIDPTEISTTQFKVRVGLSGALVAATEYKLYYKIN